MEPATGQGAPSLVSRGTSLLVTYRLLPSRSGPGESTHRGRRPAPGVPPDRGGVFGGPPGLPGPSNAPSGVGTRSEPSTRPAPGTSPPSEAPRRVSCLAILGGVGCQATKGPRIPLRWPGGAGVWPSGLRGLRGLGAGWPGRPALAGSWPGCWGGEQTGLVGSGLPPAPDLLRIPLGSDSQNRVHQAGGIPQKPCTALFRVSEESPRAPLSVQPGPDSQKRGFLAGTPLRRGKRSGHGATCLRVRYSKV